MNRNRSFAIAVSFSLMALIIAGLPLSAENVKCDNKCRERQTFRICDGDCRSFMLADCLLCTSKLSLCRPAVEDVRESSECVPSTKHPKVTVFKHADCTELCDCTGGLYFVEATPYTVTSDFFETQHYVCGR